MSIGVLDVIERLPRELAARLESDEFFSDIPVVVADEGNVEAAIKKRQAAITTKNGKIGVAVVVLQIVGDDEDDNVAFGPFSLRPAFQVVENRELNLGVNGTGKSARKIARRIALVIKPLRLSGMTTDFVLDKPGIEPVKIEGQANLIAYQVNFKTLEADSEQLEQVDMPRFAIVGETLTLVSGTAGVEIWYTVDDTYPDWNVANNEESTSKFYSDPIAIVEGMVVRACGYQAGKVASQVNRAVIEGEEIETAN